MLIYLHGSYAQNGLIAHYDGIDNVGVNKHDNNSRVWKDISASNVTATLTDNFANDGVTSGWVEDGLVFPVDTSTTYRVNAKYFDNTYSAMTYEANVTFLEEPKNSGSQAYVHFIVIKNSQNVSSLWINARNDIRRMNGLGNDAYVLDRIFSLEKDKTYTFTFVQESLTSRAFYVNGVFVARKSNISLQEIEFGYIFMFGHTLTPFITHNIRVYDRVLTEDEIASNYVLDRLRFGD